MSCRVSVTVVLKCPGWTVDSKRFTGSDRDLMVKTVKRLYLDNAATSFPKAPGVREAMGAFLDELGASPGRGAYHEAREAGKLLDQCRRRICRLMNGEQPQHVVFTLNTTDALNMAIRGIVRPGEHVVMTWLDHNSILRPLNALANQIEIQQTRVRCDPATGAVDPDDIAAAIRPQTKLIAVAHGSNVTGTLQPIAQIGRLARQRHIPFLVDAAQTFGHVPIDVQEDGIDLLAFPGHKGLLGPLGTGGLYIRPGIEKRMRTYREGGTGSVSENDTQPDFMPDRFEPGSHNAVGIIGLSEAVRWILDRGVDRLWAHEQTLIRQMMDALAEGDRFPGLTLYGPTDPAARCGVFSIRIDGFDQPQSLSDVLERDYGILSRSGLHCAPLAHQTIGTFAAGGTTRLSLGPFITAEDVAHVCNSLAHLCQTRTARIPC